MISSVDSCHRLATFGRGKGGRPSYCLFALLQLRKSKIRSESYSFLCLLTLDRYSPDHGWYFVCLRAIPSFGERMGDDKDIQREVTRPPRESGGGGAK